MLLWKLPTSTFGLGAKEGEEKPIPSRGDVGHGTNQPNLGSVWGLPLALSKAPVALVAFQTFIPWPGGMENLLPTPLTAEGRRPPWLHLDSVALTLGHIGSNGFTHGVPVAFVVAGIKGTIL